MSVDVVQEDGIARLLLSEPPLNILDRRMLAALRAELAALAADATLRVILLEGGGRHFSAGASVAEHLPPAVDAMLPEFTLTVRALYEFPLPVIAAVEGRCLGGAFELVQAADLVVAGETAVFGQPEILLGVFPPAACALLPELAGSQVTADLLFTGEPIAAPAAAALGLVRQVVPEGGAAEAALLLARRIARHSGAALRAAKRALRLASAPRVAAALAQATDVYLAELMQSRDALEGLHAFLEKRRPEWSHS